MSQTRLNFFHNTINLLPSQVRVEEERNISMSEVILMMMREHPQRWFTPWEMCELFENRFLITSIRRAMTDLERSGDLIKSEETVDERKGKPNYQWRVK